LNPQPFIDVRWKCIGERLRVQPVGRDARLGSLVALT
jgi:hypothetical protein